MKTNEKPDRPLCNFEVMKFLQEKRDGKIKPKRHLATIIYETMRYFETTDCVHQTEENIISFLKATQHFSLPKMEKLSLVNTPPRSPIDVQILIQFSEELLTDDGTDQLVQLASFYFPEPEQPEEDK